MKDKTKRLLYLGFGWLMFAVGFIGAFLPGLPTTVFMIIALWSFSKGSETMHHWLYHHPRFGPALRDWDKYRMIPIKAKITAYVMMSLSAIYMTFFADINPILLICAFGMMLWGAIYIMIKPSRPSEEIEPETQEQTEQQNEKSDSELNQPFSAGNPEEPTTPPPAP
ncbi:MAG: YbaN family protein [Emcibacteraceae bacterium]